MASFNPGDLVHLQSSSAEMTVEYIIKPNDPTEPFSVVGPRYAVVWFDKPTNELKRAVIAGAALEKAAS